MLYEVSQCHICNLAGALEQPRQVLLTCIKKMMASLNHMCSCCMLHGVK